MIALYMKCLWKYRLCDKQKILLLLFKIARFTHRCRKKYDFPLAEFFVFLYNNIFNKHENLQEMKNPRKLKKKRHRYH